MCGSYERLVILYCTNIMAHYRKPLAAAVVLNSAIFLVEAVAGLQAKSLSLIMDSFHNQSYIHNLGDVFVSFAPVLAGILIIMFSRSIFDPIIAGVIAVWLIVSTLREVISSRDELIWPTKISCGHSEREEAEAPLT